VRPAMCAAKDPRDQSQMDALLKGQLVHAPSIRTYMIGVKYEVQFILLGMKNPA